MGIVRWEKDETVAIVTMTAGENRHNPAWTEAMLGVFDEIVADESIRALVLAADDSKSWSLGIDTDWMGDIMARNDIETLSAWFHRNNGVFRFLLTSPFPVIAAVTGHAFGNGIMLACACDFRFMRADRGFLCLPEVDLGIQLTPAMIEWMKRTIPYHLFIRMKFSGERMPAAELEKYGVIRKACADPAETVAEAVRFAKTFNKKRSTFAEMKKRTFAHILHIMETEDPKYIDPPFFMFT